MPGSTLVPDGEVTQYYNNVGTIQYRMPVGYVTLLNHNTAGAAVTPESSSND